MASNAGTSGSAATGGVDSDCEGEEPEDPSSPSVDLLDGDEDIEDLNLQDDSQNKDSDDELSLFRQEWQRELESTPTRSEQTLQKKPKPKSEEEEPLSDDDRAKQLFLDGVEMERTGKLYEAIQLYKRAMQLAPDVEARLYESGEQRADTPEAEPVQEEQRATAARSSEDEEDEPGEGEELVARLQRRLARRALCRPAAPLRGAHISCLPYEVLLLLLRWVVGAELDAASLERVAAVSRGLYVAARDPDLWRALCVRTWGIECGTPRAGGFASWRQMFVERPRLRLDGCYISKTTYLRHGENSFQDQFYRPWYLIDYYRYLRFFPEGLVLMWTTADEPASSVGHLKHRFVKPGLGIMSGHYRLMGDMVVIVIKKTGDKKSAPAASTRFRARRKDAPEPHEQTFHMEFQLRSVRARRNFQLSWRRYSVCARRDQWTQFELAGGKFPPLAFSRVRAYTAEASAPLPCESPVHTHTHTRARTHARARLRVVDTSSV